MLNGQKYGDKSRHTLFKTVYEKASFFKIIMNCLFAVCAIALAYNSYQHSHHISLKIVLFSLVGIWYTYLSIINSLKGTTKYQK